MKKVLSAGIISTALAFGIAAPAMADPAQPSPKEQCQKELSQDCLNSIKVAGTKALEDVKGSDIAKRVQEIAAEAKVTAKDVLQDPEKYLNASLNYTLKEADRLKLSPETKHELETLSSEIKKLYATDGEKAVLKLRELHKTASNKLKDAKQNTASIDQKIAETLTPVVEKAKKSSLWEDLKEKVHNAAKDITEATK